MKRQKKGLTQPRKASREPSARAVVPAPSLASNGPGSAPPKAEATSDQTQPEVLSDGLKSPDANQFRIVGIGASNGGLAALEAFFSQMPTAADTPAAFVVIQHLDLNHQSVLSQLLRRVARMEVFEAADGLVIRPNCIYVTLPNEALSFFEGKLHLTSPGLSRDRRLPIDFFFRSLAESQGERSVGIILSGNGADGVQGLRAIKEAGGMTMVQDPESAEFDSMSRNAIVSGLADYVLSPAEMPPQLISYFQRVADFSLSGGTPRDGEGDWLLKIMALLRTRNGHDLSHYRQITVRRRIERRMAVNQVDTLESYVQLLRRKPSEVDILFRELLISVTSFFRDPPAFDAVRDQACMAILSERPSNLPVRVWVPACSTGEEAYSIAMLLHEAAEKVGREFDAHVFGTDIDRDAIERARAAVYPPAIAADVSPERLSRFFIPEQNGFFRIKKALRDQLIFAEQDIVKDPPFSKLDFISCRNMLIYMEPLLQRRMMPLFHYALAPGGFLLLGHSESVGEFSHLFSIVDRKWKLYRRKGVASNSTISLPGPEVPLLARLPAGDVADDGAGRKPVLREITERMLLRNYAPACVAVNEQGEILYIHGRGEKYLELPAGNKGLNLTLVAREGLKIELANALRKVLAQRQPVRYEGLNARTENGFQKINVAVELADPAVAGPNVILVTFQDYPPKPLSEIAPGHGLVLEKTELAEGKQRQIAALERELRFQTDTFQTTVEELETANAELKSANEELQSTNEELQSTNEELETAKEELQTVNEALASVNAELHEKMDAVGRANSDLNNLMLGTGIGVLAVDQRLCIQRFTPAAAQIIKLIQTDIGRPLSDLTSNLANCGPLSERVKSVLAGLVSEEAEVQTHDGRRFLMRILPYRTQENVIEGAVLTFVDLGVPKRAEDRSANAQPPGAAV